MRADTGMRRFYTGLFAGSEFQSAWPGRGNKAKRCGLVAACLAPPAGRAT